MTFQPKEIRGTDPVELPAGMTDLRRFLRRNIAAKGIVRHDRRRHPVRLENLSEQGCQFWIPLRAGLPRGANVTLYIGSLGPFDARVRWHRDGWTGVEFEFPVYEPVLDYLHEVYDR